MSRVRALSRRFDRLRGSAWLSRQALRKLWRERRGGHTIEAEHRPHIEAAVAWLERAQDANRDGGFARGYSITWNRYFRAQGWQPSYPETTGYIIPTLFKAARTLSRPRLAERAERAARWEIEIQLPSGAVRGGVIGQAKSPAVFNTGQVMLGWLSALEETGDSVFADAVVRAGRYLISTLDADGVWRRGNSRFARSDTTQYNARTAWALAEAGERLGEPLFTDGAARALAAVRNSQHTNGWIPRCCLSDAERPLLHTLAYAVRGLLEGGQTLHEHRFVDAAIVAAEHLAKGVREDGWMPGRFTATWEPATNWSCLTGQAQVASIWLRLYQMSGEEKWLEPVPAVMHFLKSTQDRTSRDLGVRGGIQGSAPVGGAYGRYQILNWATKFFIDALIRQEEIEAGAESPNRFALA